MAGTINEIELRFDDGSSFEYRAITIPKVGETIDIAVDDIKGNFEVLSVKHRVFKTKEPYGMPSRILSYVTVYIK